MRLIVSDDVDNFYNGDTMYESSYYDKDGLKVGRVEVCIGGRYSTVCYDGWDDQDASVVCRQLNLSPYGMHIHKLPGTVSLRLYLTGAIGVISDPFGEGDATRLLTNVECSSNESTLLDCGRTNFVGITCPTAGVVCQGNYLMIL